MTGKLSAPLWTLEKFGSSGLSEPGRKLWYPSQTLSAAVGVGAFIVSPAHPCPLSLAIISYN